MTADVTERLNAALEGRYLVERELGEGGMAKVYLAKDLKHNRNVALKVLKPELAAVVGAERFLTEIETTANLQHPHILPLFDSGEAGGFLYYVMPYIEGETLRERIDRDRQLPVDEALGIATAVANALQVAHEAGVVHRDIKPGNILLSRGEPLVADFGIALAVGAAGGGRLTETGLSVGTPFYMSPEQATGDQSVGPASDTYALACVLYEMLVGEPPYLGNTAQAVLGKIIQGQPVSATAVRKSIPLNVDSAIKKALEKTPADRFTDARGFAKALADPAFRHGEHAVVAAVAADDKKLRRVAYAGWAAAAAAVAGLVFVATRDAPEPTVRVERFAAPFLPSQEPTYLRSAGYDLSPDGSMLVYRHDLPGGQQVLMVRRWDDLTATPVRETEGAGDPAVSHDGLELAFVQSGTIKVLALSGGPVRTLMVGADPEWGPDGYVYATVDSGAARIPATGGTVEIVSRRGEGEGAHEVYDVLPGGRRVLLVVGGAPPEIRGLDVESGETKAIVAGRMPRYLPSGHLVFEADGTMMAARFDPERMELLGTPIAIMSGSVFWSLSDDGKLFFTNTQQAGVEWALVWVDRSGQQTPVDPQWRFTTGPSGSHGWAVSPDGSMIAVRHFTGEGFDIWVKRIGGAFSRLTVDESDERLPTWDPQGQRVHFLSNRGGGYDVWARRADGTGQAELVADVDGDVDRVEWTPDGEALLLAVDDDIVLFRPGSETEPTVLFPSGFEEFGATVSPDGRWIAYQSDETGRLEVYVRPFPDVDAGRTQVSITGGRSPHWSSDGRELFFIGPVPELPLTVVAVRTDPTFAPGTPTPLFAAGGDYLQGVNSVVYDVAPDDQRFLLAVSAPGGSFDEAGEAPSSILVNNFFEELKRMVPSSR